MKNVLNSNGGFTLIELVVVIVILGILSVSAYNAYSDLKPDAQLSALKGIAGEISVASKINYAKRSINSSAGFPSLDCVDVLAFVHISAKYVVGSSALTPGMLSQCSVVDSESGKSALFDAWYVL
ncbi:MAG: prepilin-type N-terminal cleavage/methylation domain-containing protein [Nitrospinae bacterium]|nr:prepilin-type N-terminal cleavage/methylation domain-containing protein [Nitrospinota bacterium]